MHCEVFDAALLGTGIGLDVKVGIVVNVGTGLSGWMDTEAGMGMGSMLNVESDGIGTGSMLNAESERAFTIGNVGATRRRAQMAIAMG